MKHHHTKTLGDLGVLKAQVDLYQKGYWVSIPLTEHAPFDLIITRDGISQSIQVKSRSINARGVLEIPFRQSYSTKHGVQTSAWKKTDIDIVCVYCPETDECYYFNPKKFRKTLALRVEAPKNNQRSGVNFAADFKDIPV